MGRASPSSYFSCFPPGGTWGEMVEFYTTFMQESRKTKEISRKSENNVEYIWINQ